MTVTEFFAPSFGEPFYEGSSVSPEVPRQWPCGIAGHGYLPEPSLYERATVERLRATADTSTEPGEQSQSQAGPWRRHGRRWDHGAGQDFLDDEGQNRARFRVSQGIDVWTDERRIQLLHATRNINTSSDTNLNVLACGDGTTDYLYFNEGTTLVHTTDPTGSSPTWSTAGTPGGSITSMCSDGRYVYAAIATDVIRSVIGSGTCAVFSTQNVETVAFANGRLLAGNGNDLYEIDSAGTATLAYTHFNANATITAICGTPAGIYVGVNAGDRGEFVYVGVNAATGALATAVSAGNLNDGETINTIAFYGGLLLLGTSRGFRLAQLVADHGVSPGPAIEVGSVKCLEPQAEFCWFGWTNYSATVSGLGRAKLSTFTEPLVPAYATDLMATGQGAVTSAATFGTRRYFCVSGVGLFAEYGDLVASGTINSGQVAFGTPDLKNVVSVDLRHQPLQGTVGVALVLDNETTQAVNTSNIEDSLSPAAPFAVGNVTTESFEVLLTLTRHVSTATLGPIVRRWTIRALVVPERVDAWRVPIWLKSSLSVPQGSGQRSRTINPREEWRFLKGQEAAGFPVTYQEGHDSYQVLIERVSQPQHPERKWGDRFEFLEGLVFVDLVGMTAVT